MSHANAPLSELGRLRLARCVVEDGWPLRRAAERFQVSPTTAKRWAERLPAGRVGGDAGPLEPAAPLTGTDPAAAGAARSCTCGARVGWDRPDDRRPVGDARLDRAPGAAPCRACPGWPTPDRATRQPIRRYERDRPGELVHVDTKKLGNIPDGGGWRIHGQLIGQANRRLTAGAERDRYHKPAIGYSYVHTAIDDHSRLAYSEVLPDRARRDRGRVLARAPRPGSPVRASTSRQCSPTTAPATVSGLPRRPGRHRRRRTSGPAPTGRRPTARSNGSTAP